MSKNRQFDTWWNRNPDIGKLDFEWFISPLVMQKYWEYMNRNRELEDWTIRDSDNWQKLFWEEHYDVCMKSLLRHIHDIWMEHRGYKSREWLSDALMWSMFNIMAYAYKFYNEELNIWDEKK